MKHSLLWRRSGVAFFALALLSSGCQAQQTIVQAPVAAPLAAETSAQTAPLQVHATIQTPNGPRALHEPPTFDSMITTPRAVPWVEPKPLNLPSDEKLTTITVKGKTYDITKTAPRAKAGQELVALYDKSDEALYFRGSGRGGLESKERLVVEDCTFIIDFQEGNFEEWDARRGAIFVEGFKEVLVRNCVFISKARGKDPERKVIGSFIAYDCVNVQVEDCYFEGRSVGYRGHVLVFGCGPTTIRNVEINGRGDTAGGIWVATGVGEGKIGWPHEKEPELMIYPPGPLLVENAWVHDQKGKENSDGIYVQSVQPYLLRNCRVNEWGPDDSLLDVGFRDTGRSKYKGKFLGNHGGLGMIENCEFGDGWVKSSVGLGGGLIFRRNLMQKAWFFPYDFDGGSWYVVGNKWTELSTVIVSGRNGQTDGWTPKEGMFANGSKMYLFNNLFQRSAAKSLAALYVGGAKPGPLQEVIVADYNIYALPTPPKTWAIASSGEAGDYKTLEAWRAATGNDKNSVLGAGSLDQFKNAPADAVTLPGGVAMQWGEAKVGLTGPVGVQNAAVLARAKTLSEQFAREYAANNFSLQVEKLAVKEKTLDARTEERGWASGGAYIVVNPKTAGEQISFTVPVENANRYVVASKTVGIKNSGRFQLSVNGQKVGEPVDFSKRGSSKHGIVQLGAGTHTFTYTATSGAGGGLDAIVFSDAADAEQEAARLKEQKEKAAARKAETARRDALKIKFELAALPLAGKIKGRTSKSSVKGGDYLLWMPNGVGDSIPFLVDVPQSGTYAVSVTTTNQADKGQVQLLVDGQPVGKPVALGGEMKFGTVALSQGKHTVALKLMAGAKDAKVRLNQLNLLPK